MAIRGEVFIGDLMIDLDVGSPLVHTIEAVREAGEFLRAEWIRIAQTFTNTGGYVAGIQDLEPLDGGLGVQIVNTAAHAAVVEEGHDRFHLPSVIRWGESPRVKISARGVPYLTIPFRHYTPQSAPSGPTPMARRNMMPEGIYRLAKALAPSFHRGGGAYRWGGRLSIAQKAKWWQPIQQVRGNTVRGMSPTWTTPKWQGMVRFPQIGPQRPKQQSSTYLTFRTLAADAPGYKWIIPAQPGKHIIEQVLSPGNIDDVRARIAEAVMRDIVAYEGGAA